MTLVVLVFRNSLTEISPEKGKENLMYIMKIFCLYITKMHFQVGQFVHRVIATDPDEKSSLRFLIDRDSCEARSEEGTIIKPSEFDFLSAFELNAVDGLLRVVKLLDRERVEVIRLAIRVEDVASVNGKQFTSGACYDYCILL